MNWMDLMRRIIYTLAYKTSISLNEQLGFWRWKRVLMPKARKPILIEIRKATGLKIIADMIAHKTVVNYAVAFHKIQNKD
jgi:hypothetical protein